jgi:hypothetical protein
VAGVRVDVHESCDPALVGVVLNAQCRPAGIGELTRFVDRTVASAVDFFAMLGTGLGEMDAGGLRDAG